MDTGQVKRETTILGLSEDIKGILGDLQTKLDNRFERSIKDEAASKVLLGPQSPNVLDEIIENLEGDKAWLQRISSFIESEVLPKIN